MALTPVFYVYPLNKWVSFHFIAEEHVRELRKHFNVVKVDEGALTVVMPVAMAASRCLFLLHPYFYPMQVYERRLLAKVGRPDGVIGVDVADSDHVTPEAVRLTEYAEAMVVPSTFSRNSYVNSGVRVPVYVVPHGVPDAFLASPPSKPDAFRQLRELKERRKAKLLQTWCLHSEYRKGLDLAYRIFSRLAEERKDVILVDREPFNVNVFDSPIDPERPKPSLTMNLSWLSEAQIMELMDVCDAFLLTSRGGAFEHPPLLALARGEPVVAAKGGAWEDYVPPWGLVPSTRCGPVLPNNPIHDGCGVEMDVDAAVDRLHEILDDYEGYRARAEEYARERIGREFTWRRVGELLRDVVRKHMP